MDIVTAVFPVFIVVLCGYSLRRFGFVNEAFVKASNDLIYYVLLPALLFYKIGTSQFDIAFSPGLIFGSYAATVFVFLLASLIGRVFRFSPSVKGTFVQGSFRANLAYVGLPIVYSAAGDAALRKAGVLLGFMVPLLNFLAIIALVLPHKNERKEGEKGIFREIATNPLILSAFLGIAWSYFEIGVPLIFTRTLDILSSATLPLALLCLGGSFDFALSRGSYLLTTLAALLKNLVLPLVAILLFHLIGLSGDDMLTGTIMMGVPTAVVTYVFAFQLRGDTALASTIIIVSTLASSLTISLWIFAVRALGWV